MKTCKYYNKHMDTLVEYCSCLYRLEGCETGGLLHVVLDDDNYDIPNLVSTFKDCMQHPEKEESVIGLLICKELLKLSTEERAFFFWYRIHGANECSWEECTFCEAFDDAYEEIKAIDDAYLSKGKEESAEVKGD